MPFKKVLAAHIQNFCKPHFFLFTLDVEIFYAHQVQLIWASKRLCTIYHVRSVTFEVNGIYFSDTICFEVKRSLILLWSAFKLYTELDCEIKCDFYMPIHFPRRRRERLQSTMQLNSEEEFPLHLFKHISMLQPYLVPIELSSSKSML